MKALNEKEFLALIEKYETITLEEIDKYDTSPFWLASSIMSCITGFSSARCTLCKPLYSNKYSSRSLDCTKCVYAIDAKNDDTDNTFCINIVNIISYDAIAYASNPYELIKACWIRAKHMREIWDIYQKQL